MTCGQLDVLNWAKCYYMGTMVALYLFVSSPIAVVTEGSLNLQIIYAMKTIQAQLQVEHN